MEINAGLLYPCWSGSWLSTADIVNNRPILRNEDGKLTARKRDV